MAKVTSKLKSSHYDNELEKWLVNIDDKATNIDLDFTHIDLASSKQIAFYQNGYSGESWNSSWVVFAKWGSADPIIYDSLTKEILTAMVGMGKWEASPISPSFEKFDFLLSTWHEISKQYKSILDEEGELEVDFIDNLKKELEKDLETQYIENFIEFITF